MSRASNMGRRRYRPIRGRFSAALLLALAVGAVVPPSAAAHGLVGKQDLPIPKWLFAWAASLVLVLSFIGLAVAWPTPRLQSLSERLIARLPRVLEVLCGAIGVGLFGFLVYAGLAGTQSAQTNVLPTFVFVVFWVAVPIASLLFGDVFRAFNPWRALGRLAGWTAARFSREPLPAALEYPDRLGRWPAALGILAFTWVELAFVNRDDPSSLALLALVYAVIQLGGMGLYGVERWSDRGDAFGVYFGLFARLSPLHGTRRRLFARPPLAGAPSLEPVAGTVALLCVMIGSTSFDGLTLGGLWNSIANPLQDTFVNLGLDQSTALELTMTVGLLAGVAFVAAFYWLGTEGMRATVGGDRRELAASFAHSLIPIALAYVIAHYFGLLSYQGQAVAALASDPLGRGWDLFGTASDTIDYTWITATGIWYVQILALVIGHVGGLILAHDRAVARWNDPKLALRSQYWMLAVMVAFTCLALWLLSGSA